MTDCVRDTDTERELVLEAAIAELAAKDVGSFTLEGVAARAGVDVARVKQIWANTPGLFTETLVDYHDRYMAIPDTGSLHGDLLQYARAYAENMNSPTGRRVLHAMIVSPKNWEVNDSRSTYLEGRRAGLDVLVQRAVERGECPADVDAARLIDMLGSCLSGGLLFHDRLITDEECQEVVNTLLYGITGRH